MTNPQTTTYPFAADLQKQITATTFERSDSDGWKYFNTSNEEWEWSRERPQRCDGATRIKPCAWREFHKEFPHAF